MIRTELQAAGIDDERLRESYRYCRSLNAEHGRTYFLATRLLAPSQRPAVHALYGFARYADDILDDLTSEATVAEREARLERLAAKFFNGAEDEPVLPAVLDTARRYNIPLSLFDEFLTSMRMDLTVTDYPDRAALNHYMRGSAEVIGLQMLPILGTVGPVSDAEPYAEALGQAFQLTNFLRDINEDLERNRVYLPADELASFGVDRELLMWCHANRRTDPRVRQALEAQHVATREIYREARKGVALLAPQSRPCVQTALTLYSDILNRIEEIDFEVFRERASVGKFRRLTVFAGGLGPGQTGPGRALNERWQYLLLLGGCILITLPLEVFGKGVYRQPVRLLRALLPVALVFLVWDAIAIALHIWHYNPRYVSGIDVPFMPLEEFLFFLVIPLCGLLTYSAVSAILGMLRRPRSERPGAGR